MKVALITGGSRGIGRALVDEFSAAGYAVAFTYVANESAAQSVVDQVRERGGTVLAFQADVRDYERASEVVKAAQEQLGPINTLVNNAGIKRDGAFLSMSPQDWFDVVNTNLTGTFNYTRVLIRDLMKHGGAVINVASVSGEIGLPGQTNYSASKAGIIGFTKALAKEVARFGVRVNAIAPGFVETDMTQSMDEAVRKKLFAQIPMRKPGCARDVGRLAVFLADESGAYVTAQVWSVDGGMH